MYHRILLAYDGSREGRAALREGALLAKVCSAKVYFLAIVPEISGFRIAQGVDPGIATHRHSLEERLFEEGVVRLKQMGFDPVARIMTGEPAPQIAAFAQEVSADLVVVGHHRQSLISRWWSGPNGAYLVDHIGCSLLIGRNVISEDMFESALKALSRRAPVEADAG